MPLLDVGSLAARFQLDAGRFFTDYGLALLYGAAAWALVAPALGAEPPGSEGEEDDGAGPRQRPDDQQGDQPGGLTGLEGGADERDRAALLRPPADAFFDRLIELVPFDEQEQLRLLRKRVSVHDAKALRPLLDASDGNPRRPRSRASSS